VRHLCECRLSLTIMDRLRQVDVKAEHFERQVGRVEQERDMWEKKYEVRLNSYTSSTITPHLPYRKRKPNIGNRRPNWMNLSTTWRGCRCFNHTTRHVFFMTARPLPLVITTIVFLLSIKRRIIRIYVSKSSSFHTMVQWLKQSFTAS
jgi:hypothetical protein